MIRRKRFHNQRVLIAFSLLFILLGLYSTKVFSGHAEDYASSSIQPYEERLSLAFSAVLEAGKAGANVSSLIVKLNEAGDLLIERQTSYRSGKLRPT